MSFTAEITERSLSRDRQALLTDVLVRELNVEPEEAELTALVMPALIGPFETAADRDAFLVALAESGFAARPGSAEEAPADAPPAYTPPPYTPPPYTPPPYTPPAAGPPVQQAYVPPTPPAAPPPPYGPVASSSGNGMIIGIAILLAVIAATLAVIVLTQDKRDASDPVVAVDPPPGSSAGSGAPGDVPVTDSMEFDTGEAPAPVRTDDADYALGFSPRRGVNWDVFTSSQVTRYASAPNSTPIPIRDNPSARHGTAVDEVSPGSGVTTSGCLPRRPEDGGRWCQVDGNAGWVYDRYLTSAPRRQAPAPSGGGGVQTVRLRDGQTSLRLSEGGQTWNMPRPLSPGTSVSNIQRVTLAGRSIVRFTAQDARWSTTYYWEYRQGLLHFVGTDGSRTNVSEAPGSQAIIQADQGYVPSDDVVRGSGNASRAPTRQAPRRSSRISTANVPNVIVMGSYGPGDDDALNARYAQAQQTGLALQVVPASTYDMNGDFRVIVSGPYDYATTLRLLEQVRRYIPDAFRKALD